MSLEYGYQVARAKPEFNDNDINHIVADLEEAFKTLDLKDGHF
ncbi:hypothetical protein [Cohnella thermotolerans]|nr:hypothetical protein [Cohnella thermotolerans]